MARGRKQTKRHSRRHRKTMIGGSGGATGHGEAAWGSIGAQHAGNGNQIAVNPVTSGGGSNLSVTDVNGQVGGAPLSPASLQQGGSTLGTVAVPAVLLYAQQKVSKKRHFSNKRKHRRRSTRRR